MKIQTNAGEVELAADMVRPGMVFQSDDWRCADAPDGAMTMARPGDVWCGDEQGWMSTSGCGVIASTGRFLGCDPAIAAREDVERYGVAPGIDAGAHGFARLPTGGALDLAKPENVRKGMLFRVAMVGGARDVVAAGDGNFGVPPSAGRFLGCHPAIARREDCERFGIPERCEQHGAPDAPIDAGAHGFARLRDGGAVDLRRESLPQASVAMVDGHRVVAGGWRLAPQKGDCFIGLDARYARPEDVARLCCSARAERGCLCTLAIGEHDQHEDIAAGTRWSPKVEPPDASRWTPIEGVTPIALNPRGEAYVPSAATLAGRAWGQAGKFDMRKAVETAAGNGFRADGRPRGDETFCGSFDTRAQIVFSTNADAWEALAALREDGTFSCACGSSKPVEHAECCALPWQYRMAATWAVDYTNARGQGLQRVVAEGLFGACAVALLAWCCRLWDERPCGNCEATREHGEVVHHEDCPTDGMAAWPRKEQAMRRAAEAPLVALVAAVPKGLDPVGWRAAVLAVHEASGDRPTPDAWADAECEKALRIMVAIGVAADAYSDIEQLALDAYARAVAPQGPRPAPERKRGGRDVRIVVDNGSDD